MWDATNLTNSSRDAGFSTTLLIPIRVARAMMAGCGSSAREDAPLLEQTKGSVRLPRLSRAQRLRSRNAFKVSPTADDWYRESNARAITAVSVTAIAAVAAIAAIAAVTTIAMAASTGITAPVTGREMSATAMSATAVSAAAVSASDARLGQARQREGD
jgi:hypothetical protein